MATQLSTQSAPAPGSASAKPHFRADIQGLRAVAVLLVLLYHGGLPWLAGGYVGVDVFFVISGFLITGLLIRELATTGTISLVDFYARRARRILPAALLVILLTVVAAALWIPRSRLESVGWDALGAALSLVNWQFAAGSTDYLQQEQATSPLQHYWSLAVEEQFYLVWPLALIVLATGAAALRHARRRSPALPGGRRYPSPGVVSRRVLVVAVVVAVFSFVHSVQFSTDNPGAAYFVTTTRIWELTVGAALAAALPLLRPLPSVLRGVLGWAGLIAIVTAAVAFGAGTVFPGHAALLPVLGSAAVILAGAADGNASWSPAAVLSLRPMRFIGDISYSLYLVHWPVITIVAAGLFADDLPARYGLPLALATILPAWLCYRFVERPFMRWRFVAPRRTALRVGAAGMLTVAFASLVLVAVPRVTSVLEGSATADEVQGAAALESDTSAGVPVDSVPPFLPSTADAADDLGGVYGQGCIAAFAETEPKHCVFGPDSADTTVVLVGDSHAASWFPAVQRAAEARGWQVHAFIKSACPIIASPTVRTVDGEPTEYSECLAWNDELVDEVLALDPDLMVVSASTYRPGGDVPVAEGMAQAWHRYTDRGVDVAVLNDVPRPGFNVPECVDRHRTSLTECAFDRDKALAASGAADLERAAELHGGVEFIDLNEHICRQDRCPVIVGGALLYYDGHHMTATYAATMAEPVGEALSQALSGR